MTNDHTGTTRTEPTDEAQRARAVARLDGRDATVWIEEAATAGEHQDVLSWIRAVYIVDGALSAPLREINTSSMHVVRDRAQAHVAQRARAATGRPRSFPK